MTRASAIVLAVISLVSAFASPLHAKGQPTPHERLDQRCRQQAHATASRLAGKFEVLDVDGDRLLEKAEVRSERVVRRCFQHLDSNHDGALSASEINRVA